MLDELAGMSVTFHTVACDHGNLVFRLFAEPVMGVTGDGLHAAAQRERIVPSPRSATAIGDSFRLLGIKSQDHRQSLAVIDGGTNQIGEANQREEAEKKQREKYQRQPFGELGDVGQTKTARYQRNDKTNYSPAKHRPSREF